MIEAQDQGPDRQPGFFAEHGFIDLGPVIDRAACQALMARAGELQRTSPEIFLDEAAFDRHPVYRGVNPVPGRNLLESLDSELEAVTLDPQVTELLAAILGNDYRVLDRKMVCGVPESWLPAWVLDRIRNNPVNNLGPYVRPEFRNVTYFHGIDFHQDIIDWPDRDLDFVTLYVYLHDVDGSDAPLELLADSFRLGIDRFPHRLARARDDRWEYTNALTGEHAVCTRHTITGQAGTTGLWHSCLLHGTRPCTGDRPRLSLRYLFRRGDEAGSCLLDDINAGITGQRRFSSAMRDDLDEDGKSVVKLNHLLGKC